MEYRQASGFEITGGAEKDLDFVELPRQFKAESLVFIVFSIVVFGCSSLSAIDVDVGSVSFSSVDGVLYDSSRTSVLRFPPAKAGVFTYGVIDGTSIEITDYPTNEVGWWLFLMRL